MGLTVFLVALGIVEIILFLLYCSLTDMTEIVERVHLHKSLAISVGFIYFLIFFLIVFYLDKQSSINLRISCIHDLIRFIYMSE